MSSHMAWPPELPHGVKNRFKHEKQAIRNPPPSGTNALSNEVEGIAQPGLHDDPMRLAVAFFDAKLHPCN